ncbi:M3 family metallopeptidase [Candidatus Magnetaquicoccus inordinatus]|uniref:M3 family metallopeptidase n=1 Tax=Candidatus Magnetaquicoccus inordinatus TaxID=2496818 RepID=UPI00102B23A7|nr:M3 family metallopeptidase [Candidatus Magnetaquicoccus inordinatus]
MNSTPSLSLPVWDLTPIYRDLEDPLLQEDLQWLRDHYPAFSAQFRGNLSQRLGDALEEWERFAERLNRIYFYLHLAHAAQLEDEEVKNRLHAVNVLVDSLSGEYTSFFTIELAALPDEICQQHYATDARCQRLRPWLEQVRLQRPFMLTSEVEAALGKRATFAASSWSSFYDEVEADLRFSLPDGPATLEQTLHQMNIHPDAEQRFQIMSTLNSGLAGPFARFSAQVLNMVVGSKRVEDKERGYPHPMAYRNRHNRLPDAVVEALHQAVVTEATPLCQRYYQLKARLLGLPLLRWSDRNAPLPFADRSRIPYAEGWQIVLNAFQHFSPELAQLVQDLAQRGAIDVPARPGKQSGAFNYSVVIPGGVTHSYLLLNYQESSRDVMTLAHELGHAVHGLLAGASQGALLASAPMAYAETASIFAEMTTFQFLRQRLQQQNNPAALLALLTERIETFLNSVIRQIGFSFFEQEVHNHEGRLSAQDLGRIWQNSLFRFYGAEGETFQYAATENLWCYISHFHNPFYVYAYACGELLTQSLYAAQETLGNQFEPLYRQLLRAGGAQDLPELLRPFHLDPCHADFWRQGIRNSLLPLLQEAEELAKTFAKTG